MTSSLEPQFEYDREGSPLYWRGPYRLYECVVDSVGIPVWDGAPDRESLFECIRERMELDPTWWSHVPCPHCRLKAVAVEGDVAVGERLECMYCSGAARLSGYCPKCFEPLLAANHHWPATETREHSWYCE